MDININDFLPINTIDKVDKIIDLIFLNKEPKNIYTEILVLIRKVKIQMYFKERFDSIKYKLPYKKEYVAVNLLSKENKSLKKRRSNHTLFSNDGNIDIYFFVGMSIQDLSKFVDMPFRTLLSIVKQKTKSAISFDNDYFLTEQDVETLSDFLQNAYATKIRKDKAENIFEKEVVTASYHREKLNARFRPSVGKEGNYRKLIYIRTKT